MKIALQPTKGKKQHTVVMETGYDDLTIGEVIVLLKGALVAWGFHPDTVEEYLPEDGE